MSCRFTLSESRATNKRTVQVFGKSTEPLLASVASTCLVVIALTRKVYILKIACSITARSVYRSLSTSPHSWSFFHGINLKFHLHQSVSRLVAHRSCGLLLRGPFEALVRTLLSFYMDVVYVWMGSSWIQWGFVILIVGAGAYTQGRRHLTHLNCLHLLALLAMFACFIRFLRL